MGSVISPETTLQEMDTRSLLHPFTALGSHLQSGPHIMSEAQGVMVTDNQGNRFIDAMAGLWCVNIGWGRQEMVDAIADQVRKMAFHHSFSSLGNEPAIRLADRLIPKAPGKMSKIFFGNSGSDANDTNVKLVWYYNNLRGRPAKKKIISRENAYHGVTVAAASLTGLWSMHPLFDLPLPQIRHTKRNHFYRDAQPGMSEEEFSTQLAQELEAMILTEGPETVAAFIAEPIMGAGGVIVPPAGYFREIQAVLKKYDVLLIADEVICGFGRCGAWFGSHVYDIQPDIVTIAKGLTSGYIPMSGSLISEEIWEVLLEGAPRAGAFGHGFTYSAHPVAAAAGLANLDIMEREDLPGRAATVGAYLQQQLRAAFGEHPLVGEVRGVGLVAAIELGKAKDRFDPYPLEAKLGMRLATLAKEQGLIIRGLSHASTVTLAPPLVISHEEIDQVVAGIGRALEQLGKEMKSEGLTG